VSDKPFGYPPATGIIWQGSPPHSRATVGRGRETFGNVGCVVTSVAQARRILGERAGAMPLDVQAAGLARDGVWAPGSSGAAVPELVRAQGLTVGVDADGPGKVADVPRLRHLIEDCLRRGGVALVAVDHDSTRGGDAIADHWGCTYRVEAGRLWMTDPATARVESLDWETLAGPVRWGRFLRPYQVVRVVTVWRS
jgi:hypothetical protein